MLKREKRQKLSQQNNKCMFCNRSFDLSHETPCYHAERGVFLCRSCLLFVANFNKVVERTGDPIAVIKHLLAYRSSHWVYVNGIPTWKNEVNDPDINSGD